MSYLAKRFGWFLMGANTNTRIGMTIYQLGARLHNRKDWT